FWADPSGLMPQWLQGMWDATPNGTNSHWVNDGNGNFDNVDGSGWVNSQGQYFAHEFDVLLPELQISGTRGGGSFSGNFWNSVEQHVYKHSPFYNVGFGANNAAVGYGYNSSSTMGADLSTTGTGLALMSSLLGLEANMIYNAKAGYWMGKNGQFYSTDWGGNGYTGGKYKYAKNLSTGLNRAGTIFGYANYGIITAQHDAGQISNFAYGMEMTSNAISTHGGLYGAAWGVGWEGGRLLTTIPGYDKHVRQPIREGMIKYNPGLIMLVHQINQY